MAMLSCHHQSYDVHEVSAASSQTAFTASETSRAVERERDRDTLVCHTKIKNSCNLKMKGVFFTACQKNQSKPAAVVVVAIRDCICSNSQMIIVINIGPALQE